MTINMLEIFQCEGEIIFVADGVLVDSEFLNGKSFLEVKVIENFKYRVISRDKEHIESAEQLTKLFNEISDLIYEGKE